MMNGSYTGEEQMRSKLFIYAFFYGSPPDLKSAPVSQQPQLTLKPIKNPTSHPYTASRPAEAQEQDNTATFTLQVIRSDQLLLCAVEDGRGFKHEDEKVKYKQRCHSFLKNNK